MQTDSVESTDQDVIDVEINHGLVIDGIETGLAPEWFRHTATDRWDQWVAFQHVDDKDLPDRLRRTIYLRWQGERLRLSLAALRDRRGSTADWNEDDRPVRTVSGNRAVKSIVADVRQRFLPVAMAAYERMRERVVSSDDAIVRQEGLVSELTCRYGLRPSSGSRDTGRLYANSGSVYVALNCGSDGGVRIDALHVPADRVFAVLNALLGPVRETPGGGV